MKAKLLHETRIQFCECSSNTQNISARLAKWVEGRVETMYPISDILVARTTSLSFYGDFV